MEDQSRLDALHDLDQFDTPAEGRFDRITRVAKELFGTSIALISLVDKERQWFKSAMGLVGKNGTEGDMFCSYVVAEGKTMVVNDTHLDPRFKDAALVTQEPYVRFYAGTPLDYSGEKVATLCLWDSKPREFSLHQQRLLEDLAAWAESEFESVHLSEAQQALIAECEHLRETALVDSLTRTWTRAGILDVLGRELSVASRDGKPLGFLMVDIDHFKSVNDTHGHDAGDEVLKRVADRLRLSVRPYDAIGRLGGEEFLVLLPKSHLRTTQRVGERILDAVSSCPIALNGVDGGLPITVSIGGAVLTPKGDSSALDRQGELAIKRSDEALYSAKRSGRNRLVMSQDENSLNS